MSADRYVVLGLARPRTQWFTDVGRWATTAAIPVEFLRCLSADELRSRLEAGRNVSAVLLDTGAPQVDRDLLDLITAAGAAVVAVSASPPVNWPAGVDAAWLEPNFDRRQLLDVLASRALAVQRADDAQDVPAPLVANPWSGTLVAVTGAPGAGASTIAMGLAQASGADPRNLGMVLLADLALDADQAMLHDARTLVPGLHEAVEAHRNGGVTTQDVRELVHGVDRRGYDLLLGLRHHHDWTALRPRAVAATIDNLMRTYRTVVADVDCDVEGTERTGSADVEDRNQLARLTLARASVVTVVTTPDLAGTHKLCRIVHRLRDHGVEARRILPVINRMRGGIAARAATTSAIGTLLGPELDIAAPIFVAAKKRLDAALLDGRGVPDALGTSVASAAAAVIGELGSIDAGAAETEPVPIAAGTLGALLPDEEIA